MREWIRNNTAVAGLGGVVLVGVVAWLAFGFFGIHTLFTDNEVDEAGPVFRSGAGASGLDVDATSEELAAEMTEAMEGESSTVNANDAMPDMGDITVVASGPFIDRSHPTSGTAEVLNDGTEQRFLRFEDFRTDNGPDLNVYLSTNGPEENVGDDYIDLGDLKGNIGSQNYEIDPSVDLSRYKTVVIWCVRFGVSFGAAELVTT